MKKRLLSLILTLTMLISMLGTLHISVSANNETKYICLVLDTSGQCNFYVDNRVVYTAQAPINYTKAAAKEFISTTLPNKNIKIAIVSYNNSATMISNFSNDINTLNNAIGSLSAYGDANISAGLQMAHDLLRNVHGQKDVVVLTTGLASYGNYSYSGKYDNTVIANTWTNIYTNIHDYAYANKAHQIADAIKQYATIHTIGIFETMSNIPNTAEGKTVQEVASFFRLFVQDLATPPKNFYYTEDASNLADKFIEVAESIQSAEEVYEFDAWRDDNAEDYGYATRNHVQGTGDAFVFHAHTSKDVNEISIVADKPNGEWHEIPYDYLKDNYGLYDYDTDEGTRKWYCCFDIHETGYRTFKLKINGKNTEYETHLTLYENTKGSFSPTPQQNQQTRLETPKASVTSKTIKVGEVPEFTWEAVPHAEYYTIWSWTQNKCYEKITKLRARSILTPCATEGTYSYSIYAIDADGKYKQSKPASFNITVTSSKTKLSSPEYQKNVSADIGMFCISFNNVPHADSYNLWIWDINKCVSVPASDKKQTDIWLTAQKSGIMNCSLYAMDDDGIYKQSDPTNFTITIH